MTLWIPGALVTEWHIESIINDTNEHSNILALMLGTFHMIFHFIFKSYDLDAFIISIVKVKKLRISS